LPFFLAQVHVKGLDTPLDPCAAILVLIVTALLCLGIKEVLAQSPQLVSEILFSFMITKNKYPLKMVLQYYRLNDVFLYGKDRLWCE
jgi:hypothetical protein